METRANYVAVGAFVLIVTSAIVIAVLWLAQVEFRQEFNHYVTYFTGSVSGLNRQAVVRLNGIEVGHVTDLTLDPADNRRVVVRFDIRSDLALRQGSVAALETAGLTGQSYLLITGGPPDAPLLSAHDANGALIVSSKASTLEQLEEVAPEIATDASVVAHRLALLLGDKNSQAITETLANLRDTTAALARHSGDLDRMIGDAAEAVHEMKATLANVNETTTALRVVLTRSGDVPKRLDTVLASLDDTARKLGTLSGDLDQTVRENRPQLKAFSGQGLAQLAALSGEMRGLVATLSHLSSALDQDPSRILFGDRRRGYAPP